jgi:hypothetical protein
MHTDNKAPKRALRTLGEVSELMQLGQTFKDPERFLARQARAGRIRARKVGRSWLMTEGDIEAAIESFANTTPAPEPVVEPVVSTIGMPSSASLRRRRVA